MIEAFTSDDGQNWKSMVEELKKNGKTSSQCLHRWQKVLDPKLVKGSWTKEVKTKILITSRICQAKASLWLDKSDW